MTIPTLSYQINKRKRNIMPNGASRILQRERQELTKTSMIKYGEARFAKKKIEINIGIYNKDIKSSDFYWNECS